MQCQDKARTFEEGIQRLRQYAGELQKLGLSVELKEINVVTASAFHTLSNALNLNLLVKERHMIYEPELFPTAILKQRGVTFSCFSNGKIVMTGIKNASDVDRVVTPTHARARTVHPENVTFIVIALSLGFTESVISYLGNYFVFGILPSFREGFSPNTKVTLEIGSKEAGSLTLDVPSLGILGTQYTMKAKGYMKIELNHNIQYFGSVQDTRSVSIQSSTDISILVMYVYQGCCGMASYRVYPVDVLGKHYIADSYAAAKFYKDYNEYIMAVAVKDNTHILINTKYNVINKTLDAAELFQYRFPQTQNLTGTTISASENIAVLSGSGFSTPPGSRYGAPMMSQMIPNTSWANTFVVIESEPVGTLLIRQLSDNTSVETKIITSNSTQLSNGSGVNTITNSSSIVTSPASMEVIQYSGDFMTVVPGVSQYMNEYSFVLPVVDYKQLIHQLVAIVPTEHKDGIMLDGVKFVGTEKHLNTTYGNFTTIQKTVLEGFHVAKHAHPDVKFSLLASGSDDRAEFTYGFYVGITFEASPPYSPETTTTTTTMSILITTPTSVSPPPTTKRANTVPSLITTPTSVQQSGRLCYSCHDMDQLQYCNVLRNCSSDELCDTRTTHSSSQHSCMECCSGDFCNHQGCGDIGMPPRSQRGPLCFDCQHISSLTLCPTLTLCDDNQLCSIEEYAWGHTMQYRMGCFSESCTRTRRSDAVGTSSDIGLRSVPVRHSCCGTDYCNRNISHLDTGFSGSPGIIG